MRTETASRSWSELGAYGIVVALMLGSLLLTLHFFRPGADTPVKALLQEAPAAPPRPDALR